MKTLEQWINEVNVAQPPAQQAPGQAPGQTPGIAPGLAHDSSMSSQYTFNVKTENGMNMGTSYRATDAMGAWRQVIAGLTKSGMLERVESISIQHR